MQKDIVVTTVSSRLSIIRPALLISACRGSFSFLKFCVGKAQQRGSIGLEQLLPMWKMIVIVITYLHKPAHDFKITEIQGENDDLGIKRNM